MKTIKSITASHWGDQARSDAAWYRPLEEQVDIDLAAHWVLGRPCMFLNTVGDIYVLPRVLDAANRFSQCPSDDQMQALLAENSMEPLFV